MPKKCSRFVTDYLIPSLNSQRFGRHLKWLDKKNSIFQVGWCHKADNLWSEGEAEVFVEWDKLKGHYQPNDKDYFTKSKQRFRALLYKLSLDGQIKEIKSGVKSKKKVYYITGEKKLRRQRQPSNADSGVFSTDDMSSDNNEILSEDANSNEMIEICDVNSSMNNLDDHNYSKCLIDNSDLGATRVDQHEDVTLCTYYTNECVDTGKKVLAEQNYLCYPNNQFLSKGKNASTDFLQGVFDEDLQIGSKNAVLKGNDGFVYGVSENKTPVESIENVDMDVELENILKDLDINFCNRILFWS